MLTGSWDSTAELWALSDVESIGARLRHNVGVTSVDISDDHTYLVTAQQDGLVRVWQRPADDGVVNRFEDWGTQPRISFDGRFVTAGAWHQTATQPHDRLFVANTESGTAAGPQIMPGSVVDSCICADNQTVAAVSRQGSGGRLTVWEIATGQPVIDPRELPSRPISVACRPDAPQLAVVCWDGELLGFDSRTGEHHFTRQAWRRTPDQRRYRARARYTPDGTQLILLAADDVIHVLDSATGEPSFKPIQPLVDGNGPCRSIAVSANSRMLATGANGAARVWDLSNGNELCNPLVHPASYYGLSSVCFSPDGQYLLTANHDARARLWDWKAGVLACPPLKHLNSGDIYTVAITPDGQHAVTGSRGPNCGPHIWELVTGRPIAPTRLRAAHSQGRVVDAVHRVSITPDGSRLLATFGSRESLELIDLARLLEPSTIPTEDLRILGELATSQTVESGESNGITLEQWQERWKRFNSTDVRYREMPLAMPRRPSAFVDFSSLALTVTRMLQPEQDAATEAMLREMLTSRQTRGDSQLMGSVRLLLGAKCYAKGEFAEAVEHLTEVLDIRSDQRTTKLLLLALTHHELQQSERARVVHQQAIESLGRHPASATQRQLAKKAVIQIEDLSAADANLRLANLMQDSGLPRRDRGRLLILSDQWTAKAARDWVDLLPLVKLPRDQHTGTWVWDGAVLQSDDQPRSRIHVMAMPPDNYRLQARFTRISGKEAVAFTIPVGDAQCRVVLNGWAGAHSGLDRIDGAYPRKNPSHAEFTCEIDAEHLLQVDVRCANANATVTASIDKKELFRWEGETSQLSMDALETLANSHVFGLGSYKSQFRFSELKVRTTEPAN